MQRVSSRELGSMPGTYVIEVPLVSTAVLFDTNESRRFSLWFQHKVSAKRIRRMRIMVLPVSQDVDHAEELLGTCIVYGVTYCAWGTTLPD